MPPAPRSRTEVRIHISIARHAISAVVIYFRALRKDVTENVLQPPALNARRRCTLRLSIIGPSALLIRRRRDELLAHERKWQLLREHTVDLVRRAAIVAARR